MGTGVGVGAGIGVGVGLGEAPLFHSSTKLDSLALPVPPLQAQASVVPDQKRICLSEEEKVQRRLQPNPGRPHRSDTKALPLAAMISTLGLAFFFPLPLALPTRY